MRESHETPSLDDTFRVHDADSANWVVRRIIECRRYRLRVEAWAAAELRRAQREEQFFLERYSAQLAAWARTELAKLRGRRKSIRLPAGSLSFRIARAKIVVTDDRRLLDWCRTHLPAAVRTAERVLRSVVREHVENTGELADGTTVDGGGERFLIK